MDTLNKMYHRNVNERALGRGEKEGNPYSFLPLVQVHMYPDLQHISCRVLEEPVPRNAQAKLSGGTAVLGKGGDISRDNWKNFLP